MERREKRPPVLNRLRLNEEIVRDSILSTARRMLELYLPPPRPGGSARRLLFKTFTANLLGQVLGAQDAGKEGVIGCQGLGGYRCNGRPEPAVLRNAHGARSKLHGG